MPEHQSISLAQLTSKFHVHSRRRTLSAHSTPPKANISDESLRDGKRERERLDEDEGCIYIRGMALSTKGCSSTISSTKTLVWQSPDDSGAVSMVRVLALSLQMEGCSYEVDGA